MEHESLGPFVHSDKIDSELRRRSTTYNFKSVKASKPALLKEKVKLEEDDGWEIDLKNKKSTRMKQPKPLDEQLEDELWCMVARMGFKELSDGRQFLIDVGKDIPPRQIDVFTKDDETALIIECTQCESPKSKSMVPLIEKLMAMRGNLFKTINTYYGREEKIKPRLIIATRNIVWRPVDLKKCEETGIHVLADDELDYYEKLTVHLKQAARYQFLAHIFGGTGIGGLANEVVATQGSMGGVKFYNFLIRPDDLLKIAYVGHKASRTADGLETYQRMLKPARLKKIAKYIEGGGTFPTNIVVNIKTKGNKGLRFDKTNQVGDSSIGILTLPNNYAAAWVIDGQHRLYGYAYRSMVGGPKNDKTALPVLAFEDLPASVEMKMFIDINCEQVKVQKSLLVELYSDLHWNSPEPSERVIALLARIVGRLNTTKTSPVFDRIIVTGKKKTYRRCLTQTSLSDGLEISALLGVIKKETYFPGPLAVSDPKKPGESLTKAINVISLSLNLFAEAMPEHWALGDQPGGYLCTNNAIRAIFLLMMDVCDHIRFKKGSELSTWSAEEIFEELSEYLKPVIDFFKVATKEEIQAFRRQQALAGVKKQSQGMGVYVKKSFPDFSPDGLDEYINSRDQQGTEAATVLINQVQIRIFDFVIRKLKEEFGEDNDRWWTEGVPYSIRKECSDKWEQEKRMNKTESYLFLLDYQDIALDHWKLFNDTFALGEADVGNRKKCVKWIKELNDIRKITHHPEKGVLSTDQVIFVQETFDKVLKYFPE